jgi:hypothetical protein
MGRLGPPINAEVGLVNDVMFLEAYDEFSDKQASDETLIRKDN